ncbi:MAG: peptide ABC transporter substrate-binding protein [Gemmatimonadales bacterium]
MPKWRLMLVSAAFVLTGCREPSVGDESAAPAGTVVIAANAEPDALFPPLVVGLEGRQATELIYEYLADPGPSMNTLGDSGFVKELASGWRWSRDSSSISFSIDPGARWHDSVRVTARDVVFSFGIYKDSTIGSLTSEGLADIDSVTAPDSATAVFWFARRTPRQFYDAAAQMLILPEHILRAVPRDSLRSFTASHTPVGSGPFRYGSWKRGSFFDLVAVDNHYRGGRGPRRIIWIVTPEYETALTRLLGGEADVFANIRRETIPELARGNQFNLISLPAMAYAFMSFNLHDPSNPRVPHRIFGSRDVRRAITMSLDRGAMVQNVFDTLAFVSIGPTVRAYPTTDTSLAQIPFDRAGAERLLDSLGWKRPTAGATRSKNGIPLKFRAIVPTSSRSRRAMAQLIQEQLRQVGVNMTIDEMDYGAFSAREKARSFDAELGSWTLTSSPSSIKEVWTTSASAKGGLNYSGYNSARFDALVDSALAASTTDASKHYFKLANQVIVDDAPAVWLYEPRLVLAIHRRLRTTPMRPNSWWLDIANWKIPASERLPRDKASGSDSSRR